MCVVSNIGDSYQGNFPGRWPGWVPKYPDASPIIPAGVSKEEFEALKKEVAELKQLLLAAKKFDEETGQPDCHMDDKVEFIKKLADIFGIDMTEVFGK